jgi:hypothetical protein
MIYFAHTTLCFYQKTIECDQKMSVEEFCKKNDLVVKRVCDEAVSIFNYNLSHEQVNRGVHAYLISRFNPSSIIDTEPFVVEHN